MVLQRRRVKQFYAVPLIFNGNNKEWAFPSSWTRFNLELCPKANECYREGDLCL
jgi:hypothetical protein